MAGFVEFFYNIIPGGLFLLAIISTFPRLSAHFLHKLPVHGDTATISVFVIVSLFLGFVFQMINSLTRIKEIDGALEEKYHNHNNKKDYALALKRVNNLLEEKTKKESDDLDKSELIRLHYFMDDYLRFRNTSNLHNFFHVRISFWANSMAASFIYAFIALTASLSCYISAIASNTYLLRSLIAIIVALACLPATRKSQEIFCDFVLKTFLMATGKKNLTNLRT